MRTIQQLANEALAVQDACNLSGVVHSFSRAVTDLRAILEERGGFSTTDLNTHPICILWASKIASLTHSEAPSAFQNAYTTCTREASQ